MTRLQYLGPRKRKAFRFPQHAWVLDVKPKPVHPRHRAALRAYSTFQSLLEETELEVRQHGQIRSEPALTHDGKTKFVRALRAYGGSDFVRDLGGLPLSSFAVGQARSDPDVLVQDFRRISGGRLRISTTKLRKRRGGLGLIGSARRVGGITGLRRLANVSEGRKFGSRSLRVPANFEARLKEMMDFMKARLARTGRKITKRLLKKKGFADLIAALPLYKMTLGDVWVKIGVRPIRQIGKHSLSRWENFRQQAAPYIVNGRLNTTRIVREGREDLILAIHRWGGARHVNFLLKAEAGQSHAIKSAPPTTTSTAASAHEDQLRRRAEARMRRQLGLL